MARTKGAGSTRRPPTEARQRMWQSIRVLRRFTTADVITTSEAGEDNVQRYVRSLARAGYFVLARARVSGRPGSRDLWQLVRDSGPQMPIARDNGQVYDPNTRTTWSDDGLVVVQFKPHASTQEAAHE